MYVFAGTTCVRYAEAKREREVLHLRLNQAQPACGTPRQREAQAHSQQNGKGTTCVRYAEAKAQIQKLRSRS